MQVDEWLHEGLQSLSSGTTMLVSKAAVVKVLVSRNVPWHSSVLYFHGDDSASFNTGPQIHQNLQKCGRIQTSLHWHPHRDDERPMNTYLAGYRDGRLVSVHPMYWYLHIVELV